jgi:hypothetical protein
MDWGLIINHSLVYGAIFSGVLTVLIVASLRINPEMYYQDFPEDVKAAWGPMSEKARRQRSLLVIPLFGSMIGIVILATMRLDALLGGAPFAAVFASTAIIFAIFNVVDAVFIDWLLYKIWPALFVLPGTEGMAGYTDMRFWWVNFVKGLGFVIVAGLLVAGIDALAGWIGTLV